MEDDEDSAQFAAESNTREAWGQFFLDGWAQFDLKTKEKAYQDLWIQQNISLFQHAGDQKATTEELEQRLIAKMSGLSGERSKNFANGHLESKPQWNGGLGVKVNGRLWSQFPTNSKNFLETLTKRPRPINFPALRAIGTVKAPAAVRSLGQQASAGPSAAPGANINMKSSLKQQFMDASGRDIAHDLATIRISMLGPYPDISNLNDLWTYAIALYQLQGAFDNGNEFQCEQNSGNLSPRALVRGSGSPLALPPNKGANPTPTSLFGNDFSTSMFFGPPKSMLPKANNFSPTSVSFFGRFMCALRDKSAYLHERRLVFDQLSQALGMLSAVKLSGSDVNISGEVCSQLLKLDSAKFAALLKADSSLIDDAAVRANEALFKPVAAALRTLKSDKKWTAGFDTELVDELVRCTEEALKRLSGESKAKPSVQDVFRYVKLSIEVKETFWNEFVKVYFEKQAATSSCLRELVDLLDEFELGDRYDQYWFEADELYVDVTRVDFEKTIAAIYSNVKPKLHGEPDSGELESYLCGADQQIQTLLVEFAGHCERIRERFLEPFIKRNAERLGLLHSDIVVVFTKTAKRFEERKGTLKSNSQSAAMEAELEQCLRAAEKHMQRFPTLILASDGQVWGQPRSLVKSFSKLEADMNDLKAMYLQASHSSATVAANPSGTAVNNSLPPTKARLQFLDNSKFKRKLKTWSMMFISCVNEFPDVVTHVFETYRARKIFEPLLTFIGREMIHNHDSMIFDFRRVLKDNCVIVLWDFLMVQTLDCFCYGFEKGLERMLPLFHQLASDLNPNIQTPLGEAAAEQSQVFGESLVKSSAAKKKRKKKKKAGESSAKDSCTTVSELPSQVPIVDNSLGLINLADSNGSLDRVLFLPDSTDLSSPQIPLTTPASSTLTKFISGVQAGNAAKEFARDLQVQLETWSVDPLYVEEMASVKKLVDKLNSSSFAVARYLAEEPFFTR